LKVRVLLFARYREAAGGREDLDVDLPAGSTLERLWEEVGRQVPALAGETSPLIAMGRAYARPDRVVDPDEEIAFFPPVSGG